MNENMREWDDGVGGEMKWESNIRDILIKGDIVGLGRNMVIYLHKSQNHHTKKNAEKSPVLET